MAPDPALLGIVGASGLLVVVPLVGAPPEGVCGAEAGVEPAGKPGLTVFGKVGL